ncbi:calcium-translocating P-type ATPase, SERCA-type [Paenibacillus agricola]|uniref:Calcium-translocating P-type ATPase, SERCA-type n=1 Tax=Paenibacillus agricola TaxID=2716264 RepID=A0ABX0IX09_9BACL|nr:calcium-translocating P-type ATPase, SERCA-type [Paenibacillus agricola]NHN28462.1 calcium-translocating P-type ATPase, SERCA-type [Paenibacillus agricola]
MSQKKWYQMTPEEIMVAQNLESSKGLTSTEAMQRLEQYGGNELSDGTKISPILLFLGQFKDFMVLVLVGATLISGLLGEYLDAITIVAIIIMNGILGFVQEYRAERSLRALKELSAPNANVFRDGVVLQIPAGELVPGDMVLLESGDRIPADLRFIETNSLYAEESALTGESVPVNKHTQVLMGEDIPLGDQRNLGFMGTMVTRGTAKGIIVRTGMDTEMGKIADLIQNTETMQTPLQHRLEQLGKILIVVALVLTLMVVAAGILHGQEPYGMFLAGVSLAVAAIPEGLPAIVTIALAMGVQRMIQRKAIVRKLPSVETLGCASVICSDKTGTLTQNKMTVTHLWLGGDIIEVAGDGYDPQGELTLHGNPVELANNQMLRRLLQVSVLCNNAKLVEEKEEIKHRKQALDEPLSMWSIKGDPTEGALVVLGAKAGMAQPATEALYQRVAEFPFDSERKRMSVIVEHQGGRMACTKGATDVLLHQCSYVLWDQMVIPFTTTLRQKVLAANEGMAKNALRVLGFAYRDLKPTENATHEIDVENGLIFIGLAGMIDPPRKEVREAISKCRKAGIKTVMITGDHQATAEAIAKQLGIMPAANGLALNGQQLTLLSDDELDARVQDTCVYARVSPEHKLRIVKSLQRQGHIVAMTGDGVNDAPAIKAADIGIAMGISGTDVSKEAAALVLSDDNFASIVSAIEEGRSIYENIRKFIRYLLASNVGEILVMFLAMMAGLPLPLVPIQILWVNLVTDGLPAMALGVDQAENDLMQQRPRGARENIFARRLGWKIISRGILIGVCTLAAFLIVLHQELGTEAATLVKAQTVAFATLVMAQLIHVFDCRSSRSIFHRNPLQNRYLVLAVLSSLLLMLAVLYIERLQPIFKTVALNGQDWIIVLIFAGIPTFLMGMGSLLSKPPKRKSIRYGTTKPVIR